MKKFVLLLIAAIPCLAACCGKQAVVPTVYLVGDSTCAIKTDEARPECGWGEKFQQHFREESVTVDDRAVNGRSTKSFRAEGRWNAILDSLRACDYVLIQFGHNDQKITDSPRYSSPEDYCRNLCEYVNEVRQKGATPILLTPICRRYYDENGPYHCHGEYPAMAKKAAELTECPIIDMEQLTFDWLCTMTAEQAAAYYITKDKTHLNYDGAEAVAAMVAAHLSEASESLASYLK